MLSIRNPDTETAVRRLAALTGMNMTEAITTAVNEALERRQQHPYTREAVEKDLADLEELLKVVNTGNDAPILTDADLYDTHGLPL